MPLKRNQTPLTEKEFKAFRTEILADKEEYEEADNIAQGAIEEAWKIKDKK